MIKEMYF